MFTVVGLIGMTGIIINNAIVLISTIDEHGRRRATVPAVIAASADRLRPILLTSLTTVMGLGPLMFERSSQALFLKPTVITLVYGLGLGAILVLLVVPALVVVQRDITLAHRSWRRALRGRGHAAGLGRLTRWASLAALGLLAATLGPWLVTGAPAGPTAWLAVRLPLAAGWAAVATLALGLAALAAAGLALAAVRRRGQVPGE
jgi:hypothetical protein